MAKEVLRNSILHMTLIFGELMTRNCFFPYISKERAIEVFRGEVISWAEEFESEFKAGEDFAIEIRTFTIAKLHEKGFLSEAKPKFIPKDLQTQKQFLKTVKTKAAALNKPEKEVARSQFDKLGYACEDCCFAVDTVGANKLCSCCNSPNFLEVVEGRNTCEEWRGNAKYLGGVV